MLVLFPEADLFSLVDFLPEPQRAFLKGKQVKTSFIQKLPFAHYQHRKYLILMPLAIEQLDLSAYDLVISSSHAIAKGVLTGPEQLHISYIHSPIRYAWDMQHEYLVDSGIEKGIRVWMARILLHYLRIWDSHTVNSIDALAANSRFIARRIWKIYLREARVIYPPVAVHRFKVRSDKENYYLAASRLVPYKKMGLILDAFVDMPDRKLVIIGDGPELPRLRAKAPKNVQLLGYQPDEVLAEYLSNARAFIFAAKEDFGILPVEAQACGTPVIAYGRGGVTESVEDLTKPEPTGIFFDDQTVTALQQAILEFEKNSTNISPDACRKNAERFSQERFRSEFREFVNEQILNATCLSLRNA
jgi:glycosyltransferase involved in cell wall biosynthesis